MSSVANNRPEAAPPGVPCRLEQAVGRRAECTRERCPFWECGGAVVPAGCIFDRVSFDFDRRPGSAEFLLALNARLERPSSAADERQARSLVHALLDDAFGEGQ